MSFLINNHWAIFIALEISSLLFLILFALIRYWITNKRFGSMFLILFIGALVFEALLAFIVYRETGEISTFQIVIVIFIIYASTFGISDFKRLDRYIKQKVGKWKGIDLLTKEEKDIISHLQDPKVIARRSRYWFYAHTVVIVIGLLIFWTMYGNKDYSQLHFVMNLEWFNDEDITPQPFLNDTIVNIVRLWLIVYIVDSIINWSYTIFSNEKKK